MVSDGLGRRLLWVFLSVPVVDNNEVCNFSPSFHSIHIVSKGVY